MVVNQLTQLPPEIAQLTALQSLDLTENKLTQLPSEIAQLTALKSLYLSGNKLTQLPPEIAQLTALQRIDLSGNRLTQLPPEITQLTALQSLDLSVNQLTQLPPEIAQLAALQRIDLSSNELTQLPPEIAQLTALKSLYLSDNQLTQLPPEIALLINLVVLDVRKNPIYPANVIGKLKKQGEGIYIPQHSSDLPEEFLDKMSWEIYSYLTSDKRKPIPLNEAKLILVGDGTVGKTCLVNRLLHDKFEIPKKTEGIDRHSWKGLAINGHEVRLNVWDFGGQEVLHATHQFFLTKRSIYVLVLDARRGEQESRLEYWLKLIQSFGSDSPILIAINKSDEEHRLTLNQRFLNDKYPSINGFYSTSCTTGQGISELTLGIKETVAQLPHIHDLMPASWFELKQSLEQSAENYISYDDYKNLCIKHDITEQASQSTLCGFLHDLGIVLNFRDDDRFDRLRETNVLNPEWVTNAVYKLLNNLELFKSHGVFAVTDLARMLDSNAYPSIKEHQFIIDMMRKFELCFSITDTQNYLIPELLQNQEPDLNWNKADSLRFEYHYDILPHSVFSRFIVRLHEYISKQTYWRTGVVLAHENNKALIKADIEDKKIFVWVTGNTATRRVLLGIIRQHFDHIHKTIKGLEAKEKVPYKNVILDYQDLIDLEQMGEEYITIPRLKEKVKVKELLNGVDITENKQNPTIILNIGDGGTANMGDKNITVNSSNIDGNIVAADEIKHSFNKTDLARADTDNKKSTPLETKPNQKTILIAAASPSDEARLRLDVEVRDITEGLRLAEQRDQFLLEKIWATRVRDLRRAMQTHKPTIVHFCGHGTGEQGIILEDNQGKAQLVSSDALAGFFELFTDSVECVVLNACFSDVQAEGIVKHIPYVIGMSKAIGDEAAIEFAVAFYDSVAAGEGYERAYKVACNAIAMAGISGHLIPQLFKKEDSSLK
ncbi:MAG: COR domain-containing protein [Methylococcales bacterium]